MRWSDHLRASVCPGDDMMTHFDDICFDLHCHFNLMIWRLLFLLFGYPSRRWVGPSDS